MHGCFLLIPGLNCMEICCILPDARARVREAFDLEVGGICPNDFLTSICCACCTIVQMRAEFFARGLCGESALMKWQQNQNKSGVQMSAPAAQTMG